VLLAALLGLVCTSSSQAGIRTTAPAETFLREGEARLAAGANHACQVRSGGSVRCWGVNASGQLGDGSTANRLIPVPVNGLTNAVAITADVIHSCALVADGTARCWGSNISGRLGDGTTVTRATPVAVTGLTNAVAIAAGSAHTCAVRTDTNVLCWGNNLGGQLGDGTTTSRLVPTQVTTASVVAIASGFGHTCTTLANGVAQCWGDGRAGQLGNGVLAISTEPVTVTGGGGGVSRKSVAAGGRHTCASRASSLVSCWGDNVTGQVGDGTTVDRLTPVNVGGANPLSGLVGVTTGLFHSCALRNDGIARCWGNNNPFGQLGDGTSTNRVQLPRYRSLALIGGPRARA
jgi:alpha-tubulin suppressor-like RCC1 family protein